MTEQVIAGRVSAAADREPIEPLLIDMQTAARLLALSVRSLKRQVADGQLPGVVRVRRRVLFNFAALKLWVEDGCPPVGSPRRRRGS